MSEWKDKIKGKAEELKGEVTGDRSEKTKGKARQAWGDLEGKAKELRESFEHQQQREGDPNREPVE